MWCAEPTTGKLREPYIPPRLGTLYCLQHHLQIITFLLFWVRLHRRPQPLFDQTKGFLLVAVGLFRLQVRQLYAGGSDLGQMGRWLEAWWESRVSLEIQSHI